MNKETLIETVKKLLALASSPNAHEAQLAMKRAQDLIAKYSIEINDAGNEPVVEAIFSYANLAYGSMTAGHEIIRVIAPIFGCHAMRTSSTFTTHLFGFKTNVQVALHASHCIINQLNEELKKIQQGKGEVRPGFFGPDFIHDYWLAATSMIYKRFAEQVKVGEGIVVYNKAKELMHKLYQTVSAPAPSYAGSMGIMAGTMAGEKAQLRSGVSEKRAEAEIRRIEG